MGMQVVHASGLRMGCVYGLHAWEETYKGFVGVLAKTKMGRGDLGELDLGLDIKWAQ